MGEVRVAIVGATGYVGAELLRILLVHPSARVTLLAARSGAGESISRVLPSMTGLCDLKIEAFSAALVKERADVAFCALPHGASAETVRELRRAGVITLDMSADFRLHDLAAHKQWYGEHHAPELMSEAVYGLPELHRAEIARANLIAVPGCYPTTGILALAPLVREGLIELQGIVVDAKSGVSGAGKSPSQSTHFSETSEGIRAYKSGGQHRHTAEIEQELSAIAGSEIRVTFTPHLVPMTRGILATSYAMAKGPHVTATSCTEVARAFYAGSTSVAVLDPGLHPDTLWVRGSNRAHVAYARDERTGRIVAMSTIDNLVKGAAGQGVQCMNLRCGLPEAMGLGASGMSP
ncbi:MAG TPA: N-acetyl-gamma-glutamyl-phosphate reductase [Polyangiales bacterium]|nr:N-acetyl-gamma-glutamyl-phosphate reductase [Polyangiales bacterium]